MRTLVLTTPGPEAMPDTVELPGRELDANTVQ